MSNAFQNAFGLGDRKLTNSDISRLDSMLIYGQRKSSIYSEMLGEGFERKELKLVLNERAKIVKELMKNEMFLRYLIYEDNKYLEGAIIVMLAGIVMILVGYFVLRTSDFNYYFIIGVPTSACVVVGFAFLMRIWKGRLRIWWLRRKKIKEEKILLKNRKLH